MKAITIIILNLFISNAWALDPTTQCYNMSVPIFDSSTAVHELQTNSQFCVTEGIWSRDAANPNYESGKTVFEVRENGNVVAQYEMGYRFGDGALGTYYETYAADYQAIDEGYTLTNSEYQLITLITNYAATQSDPTYYGRVELFSTRFILRK